MKHVSCLSKLSLGVSGAETAQPEPGLGPDYLRPTGRDPSQHILTEEYQDALSQTVVAPGVWC